MGKVKQIQIKIRTYYFYNNKINIEEFNSNLLKIDKNLWYIAIKKLMIVKMFIV